MNRRIKLVYYIGIGNDYINLAMSYLRRYGALSSRRTRSTGVDYLLWAEEALNCAKKSGVDNTFYRRKLGEYFRERKARRSVVDSDLLVA